MISRNLLTIILLCLYYSVIYAQDYRLELGDNPERANDYLLVDYPTADELGEKGVVYSVLKSENLENWENVTNVFFEKNAQGQVKGYFLTSRFCVNSTTQEISLVWIRSGVIQVGNEVLSFKSDLDSRMHIFIGEYNYNLNLGTGLPPIFQFLPRAKRKFIKLEPNDIEISNC